MMDKNLLFKSFIISCVKDLKIGIKKKIEMDNKLSLIEQLHTDHPACNYNIFNVIMTLQT